MPRAQPGIPRLHISVRGRRLASWSRKTREVVVAATAALLPRFGEQTELTCANPAWLTEGSRSTARGGERTLTGLTHLRVATGAETGTRGPAVGAAARRQSQGMGCARDVPPVGRIRVQGPISRVLVYSFLFFFFSIFKPNLNSSLIQTFVAPHYKIILVILEVQILWIVIYILFIIYLLYPFLFPNPSFNFRI
jgi:hypothetical protein